MTYYDIPPLIDCLVVGLGFDYYHSCTEEFEAFNGTLRTCNNSCEDPSCSMQYGLTEITIEDHLVYLGVTMDCDKA